MKIIIFGASGDLARRKLFPALYKVKNCDFEVIGYSRSKLESNFGEHISKLFSYDDAYLRRIRYISGEYSDLGVLRKEIDENTVCYLSVPQCLYIILIEQLVKMDVRRICLEKPFGENLGSFRKIKEFQEENKKLSIFFIDHYIYKPMTVALPLLYEKNPLLKEIICNKCIDNVEILFKEQLGSEGRGYFDKAGLIKDIIQNHVGVIMGTIAASNGENRKELLKKANVPNKSECLIGQYDEYHKEMLKESKTETFALITVSFTDPKLINIPFIIIAGKGMDEKRVEGRIELTKNGFKKAVELLNEVNPENAKELKMHLKNDLLENIHLVFNYSPENEIYFEVKLMQQIIKLDLFDESVIMELMRSRHSDLSDHEIVFEALVNNKKVTCAESEEVESLWNLFNPEEILMDKDINFYPKGIDMPSEAYDVIKKTLKHYRKKR